MSQMRTIHHEQSLSSGGPDPLDLGSRIDAIDVCYGSVSRVVKSRIRSLDARPIEPWHTSNEDHNVRASTAWRMPLFIRLGVSAIAFCWLTVACVPTPVFVNQPIETRFSFLNFDTDAYVMLGLREHTIDGEPGEYVYTPLLSPGGVFRENFSAFLGTANPASFDARVLVYARVNGEIPIGLDNTEEVFPEPTAAGEVLDIPADSVQTLETYTIVNWDAPDGQARVKFAQCSLVDQVIRDSGRFPDEDAAWEIDGVQEDLAAITPNDPAPVEPITGRVVQANGAGVSGVLVLLHSRFRNTLDCSDPSREGDSGYSEVLDFAETDADGRFVLYRPAGIFELLFASDDFAFRPGVMDIETPLDDIHVLAEPL